MMQSHYHFIDESGDPGLASNSSPFFILAMVELPNRDSIPVLEAIRHEMNLSQQYEFKYYHSRRALKDIFFQAILPVRFRVRAAILDKAVIPSPFMIKGGSRLMIEMLTCLTSRIPPGEVHNDVAIIDAAMPQFIRDLRRRLSQECRQTNRKRPFKKIVGQESYKSDGLQLADMVAGAMREYVTDKERRFYDAIEDKIADFWCI